MLGGELGEKYGTEHQYYNLRTPAEAIKLLCVNYPALQKDLVEAHHNGIGYKVIQGGAAMGYDELQLPFGSRPLMVVPVISGSGGSTGQILAGVGLVAASFLLPGAGLFGATSFFGAAAATTAAGTATFATALGTAFSAVGASLILGGTANLISPQPEVPRLGRNRLDGGTNVRGTGPEGITRGASGQQSYAFGGPVNTVGTGATIPVIYGRVITGGHLLSLNIDVSDESDKLRKRLGPFDRSLVTINNEKFGNTIASAGGLDTRKIPISFERDFATEIIDSGTLKANKRVNIGKTFGPNINKLIRQGNDDELFIENDELKYRKKKRDVVDVVFELAKSFYDYVGDETTTVIDAFISYVITLKLGGIGNPVVASASATLQGKFKSSNGNPFIYGHRLEVPESKDAKDIKLEFEITDASVNDAVTFKLIGYGYGLLELDKA
ncbi:putative phage-related protein tail component [uncultured Mediterranean phage uvMED]|nr:putative phage-related protein tail component [uncultured Mediterranean phage uvMED]